MVALTICAGCASNAEKPALASRRHDYACNPEGCAHPPGMGWKRCPAILDAELRPKVDGFLLSKLY
jgi:hypothetical protein